MLKNTPLNKDKSDKVLPDPPKTFSAGTTSLSSLLLDKFSSKFLFVCSDIQQVCSSMQGAYVKGIIVKRYASMLSYHVIDVCWKQRFLALDGQLLHGRVRKYRDCWQVIFLEYAVRIILTQMKYGNTSVGT